MCFKGMANYSPSAFSTDEGTTETATYSTTVQQDESSTNSDIFYFKCSVLLIGVIGVIANGFVLFVLVDPAAIQQILLHPLGDAVYGS